MLTSSVSIVICVGAAAVALGGELAPPAGPVGPTMKTLAQVEPRTPLSAVTTPGDADSVFRIAAPGSYFLTGEVLVPPGKRGIEIIADDVTLDLCGFRIGGFAGTLEGIAVVGETSRQNITVRNGVVRNVQGDGIRLVPAYIYDATNCRVESMTVADCGGYGIRVGTAGTIRDCMVRNSAYDNINARDSALIESCVSMDAGYTGIVVTGPSVISRCTSTGSGAAGIETSDFCAVTECVSTFNEFEGIIVRDGGVVQGCTGSHNGRQGIVNYGRGGTIAGCTASSNTLDGIRVAGRTIVLNNACDSNGYIGGVGANIVVDGFGNRIEGNSCSYGDFGIRVIHDENVVIRNTCHGNGVNWSIAANNVYGPIIDRTAVVSPAVNGNAAASALGSTDANANFTN